MCIYYKVYSSTIVILQNSDNWRIVTLQSYNNHSTKRCEKLGGAEPPSFQNWGGNCPPPLLLPLWTNLYCFCVSIFRLPEYYCENCSTAVHPDKVRRAFVTVLVAPVYASYIHDILWNTTHCLFVLFTFSTFRSELTQQNSWISWALVF